MKPLAPTSADLRKWRRLIKEARRVTATGAAGDLRAAAATARRAVAPSRELLLAVCAPMVRLGETFPTLGTACRVAAVMTLKGYADQLAPHVGADGGEPGPSAPGEVMPVPETDDDHQPAPRRDIFG